MFGFGLKSKAKEMDSGTYEFLRSTCYNLRSTRLSGFFLRAYNLLDTISSDYAARLGLTQPEIERAVKENTAKASTALFGYMQTEILPEETSSDPEESSDEGPPVLSFPEHDC